MTIRQLFKLTISIAVLWIVVVVALFFFMSRRIALERVGQSTVHQLLEVVFHQNWITNDFMLHAEVRADYQWTKAEQKIDRLLQSLPEDAADSAEWLSIRALNADLVDSFSQLHDIKTKHPVRSPDPLSNESRLTELLLQRLLINSDNLVNECFHLDSKIDARISRLHYLTNATALALVILMSGLVILLSWIMGRTVVSPLIHLRDVVASFADGKFHATLSIKSGTGEIGTVAGAFKDMQQRLESSYLELTKENRERAKAESLVKDLLVREQHARGLAEKANQLKDEFLCAVSHELRTPLNIVLGFSELIQRGDLEPDIFREAINKVVQGAKTEVALVNDLLDYSLIMTGDLKMAKRPVDLHRVIPSVIESLRHKWQEQKINITFQSKVTDAIILGDERRIAQALSHLLANAIKFTPSGKGDINIELTESATGMHLTATDHGIGINPDFLPHIFDSFRQEDAKVTRKYGGLGLGLAITRRLVELHEGDITASSPGLGLGAVFTITWPRMTTSIPQTLQV